MRAVARHPTPFMAISMISGAYRVEKRCKRTAVAMFYGSESRDSADVRRCFCRYAPPSVAEQEGQLIETEATGAPQNTIIH